MPTTDEARAEAVRRYGVVDESGHLDYDGAAFIAGAEWKRNRPISDEAVQAAAASLRLDLNLCGDDRGCQCEDATSVSRYAARAALEAARGTKR